jgi:hypothetical protein
MSAFFLGLSVAAAIAAFTIRAEHAGSKSEYALWAIAIVCLLISAVFALHNYLQRKRNRRIRDRLAAFSIHGQGLVRKCHDLAKSQADPPDEDIDRWNAEAVEYLAHELGSDYAMRFVSHHGLPMGVTVLAPPYSTCESAVKGRLARLNEFMTELANRV